MRVNGKVRFDTRNTTRTGGNGMGVLAEFFMKRAAVLQEMLAIANEIAAADDEKTFVARYMRWLELRDKLDGGIR